ncbi:type I restriction-modification system subunit M [Halosquirtibacter laminarini]|uniref:Type I restriction-modification system subunit M n=1 Tax=Halosquirtibacter laminarini TaxID=3374600 RepID=A0AC61NCP4_9BACT|nr:type I restriction-modification system subunit M [Prolixibacteraceae bacterium]
MSNDINNNNKVEVGFIWRITDDVLRDSFKKNEIGDVLLPFVVIRRLDCILEKVNQKVRDAYNNFHDKVAEDKLDPILRKAAGGLKFYNTSKHTLISLKDDPRNIEINFNNYLNGFNPDVRNILENFQFDRIVARLIKNKLLYEMIDAICKVNLNTDQIDNHGMGYVFEELIRISNEQSNETAGEHFTPRDVIALMNAIVFAPEKEELSKPGIIRTIYDPACGTGGMVNLAKKYIDQVLLADSTNKPTIKTYGQEINEQSFAIAKSEALITGEDANNIKHGNSFSEDQFVGKHFHYMMANPPYGVTWKKDQKFIQNEALNPAGRFYAGLPRTSDGQLLFLQHMISKMEREGSRIGVVTNGSPLFTGDAGSGESEIRKWIIENDWLECIVALPKDLFYNTGINTYIWFITNKKTAERKGKVQLINAAANIEKGTNGSKKVEYIFANPMKKSLGNKRNNMEEQFIANITDIYNNFEEGDYCKIYDNDHFGYYQLTIEQPQLDDKGKVVTNKKGEPKPDSKKRDKENVSLSADIEKYFEKEVKPHVPEAWIDFDKTRIGYEINFTKYFYQYKGLESSEKIKEDISGLEKEISVLLKDLLA